MTVYLDVTHCGLWGATSLLC